MIPIAQLKGDMDFYRSLGKLVEVLKFVAAAQYQNLEKKIKTYSVYLDALAGVFQWFDLQSLRHPFVRESDVPPAVVAVTTDAGLLGGLNAAVMTRAMSLIEENGGKLVIVGKRGQLYLEQKKIVFANFPGVADDQRLQQALQLRDYLSESVLKGHMGRVSVVFPRALSFTSQRIEAVQVLPFVPDLDKQPTNIALSDIAFESTPEAVIEYLVYLWLGQKIFEIFGMSRLAEQAARFMHLQNCNERIKELDNKLRFQYFRARHEIIDQNMRELFAARLLHE